MTLLAAPDKKGRKIQPYAAGGSLSGNKAENLVKPFDFLVLKNCDIDRVIGTVRRRCGSSSETISGSLGLPLAMGEHISPLTSGVIPYTSTPLVNFSGSSFASLTGGTWQSVTIGADNALSPSRAGSMEMGPGTQLFIAGGKLAKWKGPGYSIEPVGLAAPTQAPIVAPLDGSLTVEDGYKWAYTFYNSMTGLESDYSPDSAMQGPVAAKNFTMTLPNSPLGNAYADKKRIYRILDGGTKYYLVDTIDWHQTNYIDQTPDDSLTTFGGKRYVRSLPGTDTYILAKYAQHMWCVDGANSRKLRFSRPYVGSDNDLEYWPEDNYVTTNDPITGLCVIPGRLLVFHPRGISYVSGTSIDDFVLNTFRSGIGTLFHQSISTNGRNVVCFAEEGFVDITQEKMHISAEIDDQLQPLISTQYNANLSISSCFNHSLGQFIFAVGARAVATEPWEDSLSGMFTLWEDSASSADAAWEDENGQVLTETIRTKIWGWNPTLSTEGAQRWIEHEFHYVADNNLTGAVPLFVYHPQPTASLGAPLQDRTFLGYSSGTAGKIASIFQKGKAQDDTTDFTSTIITAPLVPGDQDCGKLITHLEFPTAYLDPSTTGTCAIKYLLDFDDPHRRDYSASAITLPTDATEVKTLPQGRCHFMNLIIIDSSNLANKILLQKFSLHYRDRRRREVR